MKTYSFIGSDKNAGKTTALNFIYRQLIEKKAGSGPVCLTSIGINGESADTYERMEKPSIHVIRNSLFITAGEHLTGLKGHYSVLHSFTGSVFNKPYVLARSQTSFPVVLEGPNDRSGILGIKEMVRRYAENGICLVDGSIDRQFIGHPLISDGICFALLLTSRKEQLAKAGGLLFALNLEGCSSVAAELIDKQASFEGKSLLLNKKGEVLYSGGSVPALDRQLKDVCLDHTGESCILYLRGALTRSLYLFFAPFKKWSVILDNFTLYQNISTRQEIQKRFQPELMLYHSVPLKSLFLKQETLECPLRLPVRIPVHNLFRDDPYEIGI